MLARPVLIMTPPPPPRSEIVTPPSLALRVSCTSPVFREQRTDSPWSTRVQTGIVGPCWFETKKKSSLNLWLGAILRKLVLVCVILRFKCRLDECLVRASDRNKTGFLMPNCKEPSMVITHSCVAILSISQTSKLFNFDSYTAFVDLKVNLHFSTQWVKRRVAGLVSHSIPAR